MELLPNTRIPSTIIDGDSFFDTTIYRNRLENLSIEELVDKVHQYLYHSAMNAFGTEDYMVALSPRKTFRNEIFPNYKSNRIPRSELKTKMLEAYEYRFTENTLYHRLFEADDIVIYMAKKGSNVIAYDKDIKRVCPTKLFDFKKRTWQQPVNPIQARINMIAQSISGDSSDGIPGVKDFGVKKSQKLAEDGIDVFEWIQMFESGKEAMLSMQLIRMDQITDNIELKLWDLEDWYKI